MTMEVLAHSSIRVTMDIYTFVRLDSQRSAFDRAGDALRGEGDGSDDDNGPADAAQEPIGRHLPPFSEDPDHPFPRCLPSPRRSGPAPT